MWKRVTTLCAACVFGFGCQKADVKQNHHPTDRELEAKYAAWAARQPRPPQQVVRHIEALLAKEPCIGALDRWSRTYGYDDDIPNRTLYPGIVAFDLKAAGQYGVQPGLHITEPILPNIDDTPIKMAWGDYEVAAGKLTIGFCGDNVGSSPDSKSINRPNYYEDLERRRAGLRGLSSR